jgi:hypothetical protein
VTEPNPVAAVPVVRIVNRIIALKGIEVPLVAAAAVAAAKMEASAVVPFVPHRSVNVLTFAALVVQVPMSVIRTVDPTTNRLAARAGVLRTTVSVELILAVSATSAAWPILS